MYPPVYDTLKNVAAVKAIFGNSIRVYPHGMAPQDVAKPYAVWQIISGGPENYLQCRPDYDLFVTQIDVYSSTVKLAADGAQAIRDALEQVTYISAWRGQFQDPDTKLYRYSFDVDFWTETNPSAASITAESTWTDASLLNAWVNIGGIYQPTQYRRVGDRVDVRMVIQNGTGLDLFVLPVLMRPPLEIGFNAQVHDNTDAPDYGHIRVHQNGTVEFEHHGSLNNHKVFASFSFFTSE